MPNKSTWILVPVLLLLLTGIGYCQHGPAITDPAKAGPDFQVQGEYVGTIKTAEGEQKVGTQIVALGDGKFQATVLHGGLPGEGWDKSKKRDVYEGKTENGVTTIHAKDHSGIIKEGAIVVSDSGGQKLGELKKVKRASPTLNAKPPAGAVVLFDGKNTDAWENGKTTDDHLLKCGTRTKQSFGDHAIHIEFRTPYMPESRDQGRGNSGVYVQGRYEVQVLDSFGLEGKNNECGGIYKVEDPKVNMCLPPLSWQTYDIDFTAPRFEGDKKVKNAIITVKHNGVAVYENFELPNLTPGGEAKEAAVGPIMLQDHGNPVVFRNVWVVEKKKS